MKVFTVPLRSCFQERHGTPFASGRDARAFSTVRRFGAKRWRKAFSAFRALVVWGFLGVFACFFLGRLLSKVVAEWLQGGCGVPACLCRIFFISHVQHLLIVVNEGLQDWFSVIFHSWFGRITRSHTDLLLQVFRYRTVDGYFCYHDFCMDLDSSVRSQIEKNLAAAGVQEEKIPGSSMRWWFLDVAFCFCQIGEVFLSIDWMHSTVFLIC